MEGKGAGKVLFAFKKDFQAKDNGYKEHGSTVTDKKQMNVMEMECEEQVWGNLEGQDQK